MTQARRDKEARAARIGLTIPAAPRSQATEPEWRPKPSPGGKQGDQVDDRELLCAECQEIDRRRKARGLAPLDYCNHRVKHDDPDQHPDRSAVVMTARILVEAAGSWGGGGHSPVVEAVLSDGCSALQLAFGWAGLSEQEQRAWELYCAGFSYKTIGRFMDRSKEAGVELPLAPSTVKEYISRGRAKLLHLAQTH